MKIAILAWGSLVWDPKGLKIEGLWRSDGPFLPIEFARISKDKRLTLVLCPNAIDVQSLWAYSSCKNMDHAIENLRQREKTIRENIGFISFIDDKIKSGAIPDIFNRIKYWAEEKSLDAVIWTDLQSNFKEKTGMEFNENNIVNYLKLLRNDIMNNVKEYIRNTPKQVTTKFRNIIENELNIINLG